MTDKAITIETLVNADITKAWEYWTAPEHIVKWNFASDDWHCPKATNDPVTGGKFSATMAAKDGSMSFDFEGTYDDVILHKRIAYTLADGREVNVLFESKGNETLVTEIFDPESVHPHDFQKAGWQAILDNYKKHTESI
jgi:uncharacterized protein YndB with AHSA1/START domain